MIATRLSLVDFRNYETLTIEPSPSLTVLVGPNAVGKTNVIEATQLVTTGMSFRKPRWDDLIRWGEDAARVTLRMGAGERTAEVALDVSSDGTRVFSLNGQPARRAADAVANLPSVTFTPEDLYLVKGPSERRRAAVDDLGEQLSPAYGSLRRDYARVVRQRNALLKDGASRGELAAWDEQLVGLGARLVTHRLRLLDRLMRETSDRYASMAAGERLGWTYDDRCGLSEPDPGPEAAGACIAEAMRNRAEEERRRGVTLVGPHRDDVVFEVDGRPARVFASQGQQRTVALAWKLAEVDVVEEVAHTRPILLLDDVMSELDAPRRAALAATVSGRTQTMITTTNLAYFDEGLLEGATVIELLLGGGAEGSGST